MKYYTPDAIRKAEELLLELGIPERVLMENAGARSAAYILAEFPQGSPVTVLAGPGKNGGDGFVVARFLARAGWEARVVSSTGENGYSGIAEENRRTALLAGVEVLYSQDLSDDDVAHLLESSGVVVDALLGIGSRGAPRGEVGRLVELASSSSSPIVALDIPSGIDPETGAIEGAVLSAATTLTMIAPKTGLALPPGSRAAGFLREVDLGYPIPDGVEPLFSRFLRDAARRALPHFAVDVNKRSRGGMAVVGGSPSYRGAPVLTLRGFLRSGGGLAFLLSDEATCASCSVILPEAILLPGLQSAPDGVLEANLEEWGAKVDVLVLGPGLGRSPRAGEVVSTVWSRWRKKLIVDGDGLYWLGALEGDLPRREDVLLTPHEGEAAWLLQLPVEDLRRKRLESLRRLADRWGVTLLKGRETFVDDGHHIRLVAEGERALAIPGSGDVLSGVIAAFAAAGRSLFLSACLGAYIHGCAGAMVSRDRGQDGLLATELCDALPAVLRGLRGESAGP